MLSETLMDLQEATVASQAASPQMNHATDHLRAPKVPLLWLS